MSILDVPIIIFIILELANVCILYFAPDSKKGNGIAIFNQWEKSKQDEAFHLFAQYMAYWVAGSKLIFIFLLLVILLTTNEWTKICTLVVMILSIVSYFWKLHPIVKVLDQNGEISPRGYSKTLGLMIVAFVSMFALALWIYFFF